MRLLKLKLPHRTKNTIFAQLSLYSEWDSISDLIVEARYVPSKLSQEFSHIKQNIEEKKWPFHIFVDQMRSIRDFGYYVDWRDKSDEIEERGLSEFIDVQKSFQRDICEAKNGALYWNEWQHSPIYFWRGYDEFAEDVNFLERFANQL